MQLWFKHHWLSLIAILAALGASYFESLPFAYYQLMNWIVVGAALMTAWEAHRQKKDVLAWLFVFAAVVFNPVAPLHLRQSDWRMADIAVALLFVLSFFTVQAKRTQK